MDQISLDQPQIVETDAQPTAVIRLRIPREEIREVMGPAMAEVSAAVAAQCVGPAGPFFTHHFKMNPEIFDFEVGVPVTTRVSAVGRVQPSELPAVRVARTVYRGGYEGLEDAWSDFGDWIAAQGHTPAEDLWESYVSGTDTEDSPVTELNQPLIGEAA